MRHLHQVEEAHESLRTDKVETPKGTNTGPSLRDLYNEASWTPVDQHTHDIELKDEGKNSKTPRKN